MNNEISKQEYELSIKKRNARKKQLLDGDEKYQKLKKEVLKARLRMYRTK